MNSNKVAQSLSLDVIQYSKVLCDTSRSGNVKASIKTQSALAYGQSCVTTERGARFSLVKPFPNFCKPISTRGENSRALGQVQGDRTKKGN